MQLKVELWQVNGKPVEVWRVAGALVNPEQELFVQELGRTLTRHPALVVIELSGCSEVDESGVTALKQCYITSSKQETIMTFAGAKPAIVEAMKPTKLEALFTIFPTVDAAMAAFAPPEYVGQPKEVREE